MIEIQDAIKIHQILIEEFGGALGLRSQELLESALARPYQTFSGEELYPTPEAKAAALVESIVVNHPFLDGNKRTGYVLMRFLLLQHEIDIEASQEDKYKFIIEISKGAMQIEQIHEWIKTRAVKNAP